jgi:hypothetical protein
MLQLVRRQQGSRPGTLQTQSKAFADFKEAFFDFSRRERWITNAMISVAATNVFVVCLVLVFFFLSHRR